MKNKDPSNHLLIRNLLVSTKTKHILHGVNAEAHSGDLMAVMGPTGSGKTTLLNAVAGRVDVTSGDVTLNGQTFNKQLRRRLGYVIQEDVFMSSLSLYETLYFTAMIRIPEFISHKEKCRRIQEIIDALDLNKCKHTVIGDMFVRGISGGEKKRANIACELLTDPDIMLLDEPTSGLDSSTAHSIMMQLRSYATHSNKTIIATVHQPSSQVYHMFSTLLLLMDGHVAYFGGAQSALDYFEKMGLPCAIHFNPADFLVGLLKSDTETCQKILREAEKNQKFGNVPGSTSNGKCINGSNNSINTVNTDIDILGLRKGDSTTNFVDVCHVNVSHNEEMTSFERRWPTSFWTQYRMLTWRQFKQSKGHILHKYGTIQAIFIALITGILYFQTDFTYRTLRDKMGMIFFCITNWGFTCIINTITSFPGERGVIRKERQSGAYRLSALYFAKMTSDVPLVIIVPIIFYAITFWMSAMGDGVLFVIFTAVNLLHCLTAQSIGQILGAGIHNVHLCVVVGNTYMLFSLLLSGFFNTNLPIWLQWAKYLSLVHYGFSTLNILSTEGMPDLWCNTTSVELFPGCSGNTTFLTKDDVLRDYGIDAPYFCYISMLGIILVILKIIGYYVLRFKR